MDKDKKPTIPSDIEFIRILWCDNANIIRAKAVYRNFCHESKHYYTGISEAQQAIPVMYDGIVKETGLDPVGEVSLVADISSFTPLPYAKGHGRTMGDMIKNGSTWEYCPRGFLKRMVEEAAKMGISIKGAFENEFYLLEEVEGKLMPTDNTPFASTYSMDINRGVIHDIVEALLAQGMEVQQYYPKSGPGQQEITIGYTDALGACDNQIAFRETVRVMAGRNDLIASFLPKIFIDKPGNECHLHLSLWKDDKNILGNCEEEHGISKIGSQFIAGVLHHLPALAAITTPIPNSYRIIEPNYRSRAFKCWGIDNKEASIRVISESDGEIKRFELKAIDASSNPYLAFGAVIAAGLDGIRRHFELKHPIQKDPRYLEDEEKKHYGIEPLPSNLEEAIFNLEKNEALWDAMGNNLVKAYIALKEAELEALEDLELDEELKILLGKY